MSKQEISATSVALFHQRYQVRDAGFETPCWLWTLAVDRDGYPRFKSGERQGLNRAHQFSYFIVNGAVPDGLHLDHLCRNRHCVNPEHLEPVTCRENLMRGETYAAAAAAKSFCKRGHPLSGGNLYIPPGGTRKCRICVRRRKREYRARRKAEGRPVL